MHRRTRFCTKLEARYRSRVMNSPTPSPHSTPSPLYAKAIAASRRHWPPSGPITYHSHSRHISTNGSIGSRTRRPTQPIHHLAPIRTCGFAISFVDCVSLRFALPDYLCTLYPFDPPSAHSPRRNPSHSPFIVQALYSRARNIQQKGKTRQYIVFNSPVVPIIAIISL
jgi:hypothetical protein